MATVPGINMDRFALVQEHGGVPAPDMLAEIVYGAHLYMSRHGLDTAELLQHLRFAKPGMAWGWSMYDEMWSAIPRLCAPPDAQYRALTERCATLQTLLIAEEEEMQRYPKLMPLFATESGGPMVDIATGPRGIACLRGMAAHGARRPVHFVDRSPFVRRLLEEERSRLGLDPAIAVIEERDADDIAALPQGVAGVQLWNVAEYLELGAEWCDAIAARLTEPGSRVVLGAIVTQSTIEYSWPRPDVALDDPGRLADLLQSFASDNLPNFSLCGRLVDSLTPAGWSWDVGSGTPDGTFRPNSAPETYSGGVFAHILFTFTKQAK